MPDILFLTLRTFSKTGGIEKVCRIVARAINENRNGDDSGVEMWSMYDADSDAHENPYYTGKFRGWEKRKLRFVLTALAH